MREPMLKMSNISFARHAAVLGLSVLMLSSHVSAAKRMNRLGGVQISADGEARALRINTRSEPTFTVFRLSNPMRVVIDISEGEVGDLESPIDVQDGMIKQVSLRQFRADGYAIARVTVSFEDTVSYDVAVDGNAVLLRAGKHAQALRVQSLAPPARPAPDLDRLRAQRLSAEKMAKDAIDASKRAESLANERRTEVKNLADRISQTEQEKLALQKSLETVQNKKRQEVQRAIARAEKKEAELREAEGKAKDNELRAEKAAKEAILAKQNAAIEMGRVRAEFKKLSAELEIEKREAVAAKKDAALAQNRAKEAEVRAKSAESRAREIEVSAASRVRAIEKKAKQASVAESERLNAQAQADAKKVKQYEEELAERAKSLQARESQINAKLNRLNIASAKWDDKLKNDKVNAQKVASLGGVSRKNRLDAVLQRGDEILLETTEYPIVKTQRIENPPRLVIDFEKTSRGVDRWNYRFNQGLATKVRLGPHGDTLRAVIDLRNDDVEYKVLSDAQGIRVKFKKAGKSSVSRVATVKQIEKTVKAKPRLRSSSIQNIHFAGGSSEQVITIAGIGNATYELDDRSKRSWLLKLRGATVSKSLEKSLNTGRFKGPVAMISTYQASNDTVNVVLRLRKDADGLITKDGNSLKWTVVGAPEADESGSVDVAGFASQAASLSSSVPRQSRKQRVSIKFRDADLVEVVRFIAEAAGQNVIVASDVSGKVTVNLRNVPWDRALDVILKSQGYDSESQNNILRVAKAEALRAELEARIKEQENQALLESPVTKVITLNYAQAKDVVSQLKDLMSERGAVQVNDRVNSLIIKDVPSNIRQVQSLVRQLDRQTPQVLIEARIVEANSNFEQELGIQWGGGSLQSPTTGNATGVAFPNSFGVQGGADGAQPTTGGVPGLGANNIFAPGGYAINLPAAVGEGSGGALGFIFGSADGNQLLNLRLSALESSGKGKIISAPRITTLDNETAKISQGTQIPISVVSAAGVNTRFIDAALELEVTPQVTNDGSILMEVLTKKNEPDFQNTGASGDPTIVTKEATTNVMVRDGDTAVIGGIYTRNTSESTNGVPFLSKIPILGWLFKKRRKVDLRSELLIFITPRIVNREDSRVDNSNTITLDTNP